MKWCGSDQVSNSPTKRAGKKHPSTAWSKAIATRTSSKSSDSCNGHRLAWSKRRRTVTNTSSTTTVSRSSTTYPRFKRLLRQPKEKQIKPKMNEIKARAVTKMAHTASTSWIYNTSYRTARRTILGNRPRQLILPSRDWTQPRSSLTSTTTSLICRRRASSTSITSLRKGSSKITGGCNQP